MDEIYRKSLLFDFYGPLLTKRQQEIYLLYRDEDMSLGEIGAYLNISRQAVHDLLKRTEKLLYGYEDKLHLVEKFEHIRVKLSEIRVLLQDCGQDRAVDLVLGKIAEIDSLERR